MDNMRKMMILLLILLATLCYADPDYYFKQGSPAEIKIPCVNNGQACNVSTSCNLTVTYPNGSNIISNQPMSFNPAYFNYTLQNTNLVGQYAGFMYCINGVLSGSTRFNMKINATGETNTNSYMLFVLVAILMIFAVVMTILFGVTGNDMMAQIFMVMAFVFTTVFSYFGWQISKEWGAGWAAITYGFYLLLLFLTIFMLFLLLVDWTIAAVRFIMTKRQQGDNLL